MKTLMKKGGIALSVSRLDGYLKAVRDINDDHNGNRYWFWADMVYINNRSPLSVINQYLKTLKFSGFDHEIKEINLREELEIIESQILDNYLQGSSNPQDEKQKYIKRLHGWRIQEYISLMANYEKEDGRWVATIVGNDEIFTSIFVQIKNHLVIMSFHKRLMP